MTCYTTNARSSALTYDLKRECTYLERCIPNDTGKFLGGTFYKSILGFSVRLSGMHATFLRNALFSLEYRIGITLIFWFCEATLIIRVNVIHRIRTWKKLWDTSRDTEQ